MDTFVVEGTLLRVLQLSRILGGAPLKFVRNGGTVTASVSYPWFIYSCVTTTILNLLSHLLYYFQPSPSEEIHRSRLFVSLWIAQNVLLTLRVCLGSVTSYARMKSMALQMNGLQKVFREFNKKSTSADRQTKVLILVLLLIILLNIIRVVGAAEKKFDLYPTDSSIFVDVIVFCLTLMSILQEAKLILINVKLAEAFHILKMHLTRLLRGKRLSQQELRRVGRSYLKLYDVISESNRCEGGVMFLMFATIVAFLVYAGFVFAGDPNNPEKSHLSFDTLMIAVPSIACIHRVIIFTTSCHQIHKEIMEINMAASELVYTTEVGCDMLPALEMFVQQLQLTPVVSVLGVFTVKQSTLTTILSAWVTYTVILIQVRSQQGAR